MIIKVTDFTNENMKKWMDELLIAIDFGPCMISVYMGDKRVILVEDTNLMKVEDVRTMQQYVFDHEFEITSLECAILYSQDEAISRKQLVKEALEFQENTTLISQYGPRDKWAQA